MTLVPYLHVIQTCVGDAGQQLVPKGCQIHMKVFIDGLVVSDYLVNMSNSFNLEMRRKAVKTNLSLPDAIIVQKSSIVDW